MKVIDAEPLDGDELDRIDRYWRAANYLAVGQIYLLDNPLLREELCDRHVKPRLLGHWGTTPGLNLIYAHMQRVIAQRRLDAMVIAGPGHGGPAVVANAWLDGSRSETYPGVDRDGDGMAQLFRQFSFPGGIPSHAAADVPGSIHEGGELGYSLSHAFGAAFDNPELVVTCIIGDGEAETGPLAASWHGTKFLDPAHDGAVLPVLHLNGYKIANPALLDRIGDDELTDLLRGSGWEPALVEGDEPCAVHQAMAAALDAALDEIDDIRHRARNLGEVGRRRWPMIVLRTPKGWTGPEHDDAGRPVEGTWRSHQVPLGDIRGNADHRRALERWLRSYRPAELFDTDGRPRPDLVSWLPCGDLRLGMNPHANGGRLRRPLDRPPVGERAVAVEAPGQTWAEPTSVLGSWLRDLMATNLDQRHFRLFGPDETASNRLSAVYEVTDKTWNAQTRDVDEHLAVDGRVMELLSEHTCQGWLEGYLLTGRHGVLSCYEAFIHIVDSMVNQHAKWLKVTNELEWRRSISSLTYLLTSHVWRQDHNGFSHQDPGFIDHVANKKADVVRIYLPPDANCLLATMDHCLQTTDYVNVVVSGKQPTPTWLSIEDAAEHCARGIGRWDWASTDTDEPDVVLACAGDVPTVEALAAASLLREHLPDVRVRVVNVVDLMRLQHESQHPHGLSDRHYDALFTTDRPVVFAFHGYPWLIHRLTYKRAGHRHLQVRGYTEEGTTTTPFDMLVRNDLDRFHLVMDVIDRLPGLGGRAVDVRQRMVDARHRHRRWIREHGEDLPEVRDWLWPG
ncbi:MAG: phosphoketolase family protein [Acidimicrobiales bacterium]